MAYTAVNKSSNEFITKRYEGNAGTKTIVTGTFAPTLSWIKKIEDGSNSEHCQFDTTRGATKVIQSSTNEFQQTISNSLTAFTNTGFTLGAYGAVNGNGDALISMNWKGGTTSSITTNGTTTITPSSYSFNQTNGFSTLKYSGNGVDGAYLAHGLGKAPKLMIVKRLTDNGSHDWYVYHASLGNQKYLKLNASGGISGTDGMWGSFTPDVVNMKMSNDAQINTSGKEYVMYCWSEIPGYSKFGTYLGNASATDGSFVFTGFAPEFVICKTVGNDSWLTFSRFIGTTDPTGGATDYKKFNRHTYFFEANSGGAPQSAGTNQGMDMYSNGFKLFEDNGNLNGNNQQYVYLAWGQALVGTNNTAATAR